MKRTKAFMLPALLIFTAVMASVLAGCSGKKVQTPAQTPPTAQQAPAQTQEPVLIQAQSGGIVWEDDFQVKTAVTADNYKEIIKVLYGLNVSLPSGWTFKSGVFDTSAPTYRFFFETTASDFTTAVRELAEYLFSLAAEKGNYSSPNTSISELPSRANPYWLYKYDSKGNDFVQVNIVGTESAKTVSVKFNGARGNLL